jgi:hypothetical protein
MYRRAPLAARGCRQKAEEEYQESLALSSSLTLRQAVSVLSGSSYAPLFHSSLSLSLSPSKQYIFNYGLICFDVWCAIHSLSFNAKQFLFFVGRDRIWWRKLIKFVISFLSLAYCLFSPNKKCNTQMCEVPCWY